MAELKIVSGINLANQKGINFADPTVGTDAVNLQTLRNYVAGLSWKAEVRAATTTTGTLATDYAAGSTIDGVVLAAADRILIKDQATQTQNGIYVVQATGAPVRADDADITAELNNATVFVDDGTVNGGLLYTQTTKDPIVGTDPIVFARFAAGVTYSADGNGIELTGGVFSIELDGTTLAKSSAGLRIGSGAAGAGLGESSGVLAVNPGAGITIVSDAVAIDPTVVTTHYSQSIGNGSSTAIAVTHSLGTKDVSVTIRDNSTDEVILTQWIATSTTVATINFPVAPTTSQYRVTVQG